MEARTLENNNFALMTAAPVNNPSAGMSNRDVAANRAQLRQANLSAAAALKAQLTGAAEDVAQAPPMEQKGVKRKADEIEEEEEGDSVISEDDDEPETYDPVDPVEAGKAILKKFADEKKEKEVAAREREPDDAVR